MAVDNQHNRRSENEMKITETIQLAELTLRPLLPSDFNFYYEMVSNRKLAQLAGFRSANDEFEGQFMFNGALRDQRTWLISTGNDQAAVGTVLLAPNYTADARPIEGEYEIGYVLLPQYWGQRIMSRILPVVVATAFKVWQTQKLVASVLRDNVASRQLLVHNGFIEDHVIQHAVNDWIAPNQQEIYYHLTLEGWKSAIK